MQNQRSLTRSAFSFLQNADHALPFPHTQMATQGLHLQSKSQASISPSLSQLNGSTFSGTTLLQLYICRRLFFFLDQILFANITGKFFYFVL